MAVASRVNNQKLLQGVQGDGFLEKSPPGKELPDVRNEPISNFLAIFFAAWEFRAQGLFFNKDTYNQEDCQYPGRDKGI
jgi:hypothetical protein